MEKWKILRIIGVILVGYPCCIALSLVDFNTTPSLFTGLSILAAIVVVGIIIFKIADNQLSYYNNNRILSGNRIYPTIQGGGNS
ncbi:MAG: hypothetical protein V1825_04025 [Candidatus Falkowbacteria bacterium]|nr:hypothetical protein [Candidatus Parcubacteria bacterium]